MNGSVRAIKIGQETRFLQQYLRQNQKYSILSAFRGNPIQQGSRDR